MTFKAGLLALASLALLATPLTFTAADLAQAQTVPAAKGMVMVIKNAIPDDGQDFQFSSISPGIPDFALDDDSSGPLPNKQLFQLETSLSYTITETATPGWMLSGITCVGGTPPSVNLATGTMTVTPVAGQVIKCTFTNVRTLAPCTNYPAQGQVHIMALPPFGGPPAITPKTVHICKNGTVRFTNLSGAGRTVSPTLPAASFGTVSPGSGSSVVSTAFNGAGTYTYQVAGYGPKGQGKIVVHP